VTAPTPTRRLRRPIAALAAAAITLAACGGDDEPVAAPEEPGAEQPADTRPPVDGPVSTLSPDLPDSFDGQVGPVDVLGDPLTPLVSDVDDPSLGQQVPVLVGLDIDDRPIRIDPAADGPTMLVFVAHWCPHCNDEIPKLNRMRAYAQFPGDLNVVAVSTAVGPDRPNWPPVEWLRDDMNWKYPAMLDGIDIERESFIAAEAYGVTGFPFTVLVNADGTVADRWSGGREAEEILARVGALGLA
jgi:cytochrome c biogenesis protein CcmG, thiol:disulfide interchange protein DsbE